MKEESGSLHLPMALGLGLLAIAGLGEWSILHRWRARVELQLEIDRGVAEEALGLRDLLERLASENHRIEELRLSVEATSAVPPANAAARAALLAMTALQEAHRHAWSLRRVVRPQRVAPIPVHREPPDAMGPLPLSWDGTGLPGLLVAWRKNGRSSTAIVREVENAIPLPGNRIPDHWQTAWTRGAGFGPGPH